MHAIFAVHYKDFDEQQQKNALSYRKSSISQCTVNRLSLYEETQLNLDLITN